jgi:catechol 2,3-dioxygenase
MTQAPGVNAEGDRLPAATRVGGVRLQVGDLARSVAWYERVLGMAVLTRGPGRATLGTAAGTPLVELIEQAGTRPVQRRSHLGLFHFAILLPDRTALGRFLRHLASVDEPVGASDHLVSEALYLHDPDGLGIEVYADRPRSTWTRQDGELTIRTLPLDLEDVLAAGGDAPWTGMPEGTVMGHMHLHVGDLEQAAAFYRDALGFDATVWSYPGALFLSAGGYHHHLGLNIWAGPDARPPGETDARLLQWELVLPDPESLERASARLQAAGHTLVRTADGHRLSDPWGTSLLLRD